MPDTVTTEDLVQKGLSHHRAGDLNAAEAFYREALAIDSEQLNAIQLLGVIALSNNRTDEALTLLERAVKLLTSFYVIGPQHSTLYNNYGNVLSAVGRRTEAIAAYRRSLKLSPDNAEVHFNLGNTLLALGDAEGAIGNYTTALSRDSRAMWHHQLGKVYETHLRVNDAEASYRAALQADEVFVPALYDLGLLLYLQRQEPAEAIVFLERLRAIDPDYRDSHLIRGNAYRDIFKFIEAVNSYQLYLSKVPESALAHFYLGMTLSEIGRIDEAIASIMRGVELDPSTAGSGHLEIGNALLRAQKPVEAEAHFLKAMALQPVFKRNSILGKAPFKALFLMAPGLSNTPYTYLTEYCEYDAYFLPLLVKGQYDTDLIRTYGDVVVNLVSDADQGLHTLALAVGIIGDLAKPVINHPSKIIVTDRGAIARKLARLPGCRVAHVERSSGGSLLSGEVPGKFATSQAPFLVRVAGLHGGEAFEIVTHAGELRALVGQRPEQDYYLMDYVDYQSLDGFFRKYRFFCVDGVLYPYHLAIDNQWKVHQFRTDMANQIWMQHEEEAFLAKPTNVFDKSQMATLNAVTQTVGLDFMGIDCSLDRDGKVVVFEVNATMLVNGDTHAYPYKTPYVRAIKSAFNALLARRASVPP